ncbi:conserved hypothetical protein [Coccidioides posadasii str. Silveira]|uniref:Uncharacterized protein n=2 Tax=Coccidioides posadasii (strain RMSCC 757 / Silveira) TaxID=443226 RepID=E9DH02_COCPS|nr:conserved hypothetical protein [Coccidioides posadasii str. Silveira]
MILSTDLSRIHTWMRRRYFHPTQFTISHTIVAWSRFVHFQTSQLSSAMHTPLVFQGAGSDFLETYNMTTKLTLGAYVIKVLMEQASRFDAMSVYLGKLADLATSQAEEIAKWTSKLIDAVTKI